MSAIPIDEAALEVLADSWCDPGQYAELDQQAKDELLDTARKDVSTYLEAAGFTVRYLPVCQMGGPKGEEHVRWGECEDDERPTPQKARDSLSDAYLVVGVEGRLVTPWRPLTDALRPLDGRCQCGHVGDLHIYISDGEFVAGQCGICWCQQFRPLTDTEEEG